MRTREQNRSARVDDALQKIKPGRPARDARRLPRELLEEGRGHVTHPCETRGLGRAGGTRAS